MPMPVSTTDSSTSWSVAYSRTVIPPVKVNFSAFETRFMTILAHISAST